MKIIISKIFLSVILVQDLWCPVYAQRAPVLPPLASSEDPPVSLSLSPIGELTPDTGLSPFLRGARSVRDPSKWKASFYSTSGKPCTATLIGPQVLLLAAHCIANGGTTSFKVAATEYGGSCEQAKGFRTKTDLSADYALCKISPTVVGITFERINQDPALIEGLKEVLLSGFGCTQDNGTGGNDGTFRIGESPISSLPAKGGNIIVTKGGAALCVGDSGGAVFTGEGTRRRVLAVNVRTDPDGAGMSDISRVASLSSDAAREFLATWLGDHAGTKICGIGTEHQDCRR